MKTRFFYTLIAFVCTTGCYAQLSQNPHKFLGNITTNNTVRSDFSKYWNQLTPENETKWASIEGTRGTFRWTYSDAAYNYCKQNGIPFKFHTLVWGSQYPSWMDNLTTEEQLEEITIWFDSVAAHYPDLEYIDVVNEAIKGHAPAPYKDALGGDGESGYDWVVTAFKMARERWPNAVLIYNDYNTFKWNITQYIDLMQKIVAAGAPVDAMGCQTHDLSDMSGSEFKAALERIHDSVNLPIFITEYDIDKTDDETQLKRYKEQIPVMWEADYVAGVTLWGYIYGSTWVTGSGLIRSGKERPALQWLREYMATDAALNAKSPMEPKTTRSFFAASSYKVKPETTVTLSAGVYNANQEVDTISIYLDDSLIAQSTQSPLKIEWQELECGVYNFSMVASISTTIITHNRTITIYDESEPFTGTPIALPGIIEFEDFDSGRPGIAYYDTDDVNEGGSNYRNSGVDVIDIDGGHAISHTATDEWMLYTVTVENKQIMDWTLTAASGTTGSTIRIFRGNTDITGPIEIPKTADNDWSVYTEVKGTTIATLPTGTYQLKVVIESPYCNIDKIVFSEHANENTTGITDVGVQPLNGTYEVYSVMGIKQGTIEICDNNTTVLKRFGTGIHILVKKGTGEVRRIVAY